MEHYAALLDELPILKAKFPQLWKTVLVCKNSWRIEELYLSIK